MMDRLLIERLCLKNQPVGIWFTDDEPENVVFPSAEKRSCVVAFMLGAVRGKDFATSESTTTCPGGAVGLCFGDAFTRRGHATGALLSMGKGTPGFEDAPLPPHMARGERFYDCPDTVQKWKDALPFAEVARCVVMRRFDHWELEERTPDLVWLLVNPDQLSAFAATAGFRTGHACNVIAPQCAGCQSVLYAHAEIDADEPRIVMGAFDLSQRGRLDADLLSLTMPYGVFHDIAADCEANALSSHSWERLRERLNDTGAA